MGHRVFFSFHYADIFRVNNVRHSWQFRGVEDAGFWDASIWHEAHARGDAELEKFIRSEMENTAVTAVLISHSTANRKWINFEIEESRRRGNGLLGIYIHKIEHHQDTLIQKILALTTPPNPFDYHTLGGKPRAPEDSPLLTAVLNMLDPALSKSVPVYDWVDHNGYSNFGSWVQSAYIRRVQTAL